MGRKSRAKEYICHNCGITFQAIPSTKKGNHVFHNRPCYYEWQTKYRKHEPYKTKKRYVGPQRKEEENVWHCGISKNQLTKCYSGCYYKEVCDVYVDLSNIDRIKAEFSRKMVRKQTVWSQQREQREMDHCIWAALQEAMLGFKMVEV